MPVEKRILVIGELNVDIIVSGLGAFPALGQEVLAAGLQVVLGSSSAICAAGLARLGARVDFLGKVGADGYGDFVVDQLRQRQVGVEHVQRDDVVRTGVTISLTFPDDRALITYLGCIPHLSLEDVNLTILRRYHHLHVGSYFLQERLQPGLPDLFRQAHRLGLTVSLDTGHDPAGRWGGEALLTLLEQVDIFLPNQEEACAIARRATPAEALQALSERARLVVVKCGPEGAMSLTEGQIIHSPGFSVNVVDTTGAGDSFDAGFIHAHVVQGLPLLQALRFANACGALSTTAFGGTAGQPTLTQALAFIKERSQ